MSLFAVISSLKTATYTVRRVLNGTYSADGLHVPGVASTLSVDVSLQPLSGKDVRSLPQGRHVDSTKILWTLTQLLEQTPTNKPDIVEVDGEDWEVFRTEHFGILEPPGFYRVSISRLKIP